MLLAVNAIGKAYGGQSILDNVSFSLGSGDRSLLLGPSGSGKSTLINIICGLQTPDTGSVAIDGETVASATEPTNGDAVRRRALGIVFQTLRLVSALTVRANLALAQRLQSGSVADSAIDQILDTLGIAHRANARPFELSQGEAQRAAIARALVVKPKLLIADEPTSALDASNAERVAALLMEAADSVGAALLIATHDERLRSHFRQSYSLREGTLVSC